MANDEFQNNLLRTTGAELHFQTGLLVARELYGKSCFALGAGEKGNVDQTVLQMVGANYGWLTPERLQSQETQQPVGFQGLSSMSTPDS